MVCLMKFLGIQEGAWRRLVGEEAEKGLGLPIVQPEGCCQLLEGLGGAARARVSRRLSAKRALRERLPGLARRGVPMKKAGRLRQ